MLAVVLLAAPHGAVPDAQQITAAADALPAWQNGERSLAAADPAPPPGDDLAIPPAPPAFAGAPPRAEPLPGAVDDRSPRAGGTWAVVIGINDYPGDAHDLRAAVADADDMAAALTVLGVPADRVLVLRDGQATSQSIRRAIAWLAAHAGPDAVAAFFYAGHVRKQGRRTEAIVGADGVPVPDADLAREFAGLVARRAWFAFAACYGAGFTELLGPGRVLTGAAGADNLAYENASYGRSYLVEYMVRRAMIQQRAPTSVQAAFAYAQRELARDHPDRQPAQIDHAGGPLDLRPPMAGSPATPPPRSGGAADPSPSSPPPSSPPPSSPPPRQDGCAQLTAGIVSCGP